MILGRLASNARNHLGKLEGGLAYWYENQIADVMGRLGDAAPRLLDLNGQGLFALGYYQQLATLRAGKKTNENATCTGPRTCPALGPVDITAPKVRTSKNCWHIQARAVLT